MNHQGQINPQSSQALVVITDIIDSPTLGGDAGGRAQWTITTTLLCSESGTFLT